VAERVGVPGYPGPFAVGRYAGKLRDRMRQFAPVCVIGEVTGVRIGRGPNVYFELRDADGALPCAMWRNDFDSSGLGPDELRDGVEVVAAGHCDFYPGSATSSPRFSFRVEELRLAGGGTCSRGWPGCGASSHRRACSSTRSCSRVPRCRGG
jgi:exodeoxyribonuclease VII large subunit